jgi:hypothetical protein
MRILRGLSSRFLSCGCLAGVYETYDGDVVGIIDAKGPRCTQVAHRNGNLLPVESSTETNLQSGDSDHRSPTD